ncbi:MAG TPA: response regulator [Stellaceae bacterium]|nr:response regulator [Stellaceae bacterium]
MQERQRILVIEDDSLNAKLIADILELAGWQVIGPSGCLNEAVTIAASGDFEAAVLDINLGGEDVYPVAEVLSERKIPFAFLTAYDAKAAQRPFREQPLLRKPFKLTELIDIVAGLSLPERKSESVKAYAYRAEADRLAEWVRDCREKTLWRLHCSESILQVDAEPLRNSKALIAKTIDCISSLRRKSGCIPPRHGPGNSRQDTAFA